MTALDRWGRLRDNAHAPPRRLRRPAWRPRRSASTHATLLTVAAARAPSLLERLAQPPPHAVQAHPHGRLGTPERTAEVAIGAVLPVVREHEPAVLGA